MLLRRSLKLGRHPLLRPLRPPNVAPQPRPRLFTQNHPLLLLTRISTPRPQIPYLAQPCSKTHIFPTAPALQRESFARLLSTETKAYVREQTWLAFKWNAIGWTMFGLLCIAYYGWQMEMIEREHPTPAEWGYWPRSTFRGAHARLDPNFNGFGIVDWAAISSDWRICIENLEDLNKDGKGLKDVQEEGDVAGTSLIPGVGRAGYDITAKSWAWRDGYFQALMGSARAAEFLDDMVLDKTRKIVFPKNVMIGPSNPNPRPVAPNMKEAPREENCTRPYPPPETFYIRVLTGKGFSTRHRLDAALAYANWLEYKGMHDTAEDVYRWGVDITSSALPAMSGDVIDPNTGILKESGSAIASANLLRASTALATHFARTGLVTNALPIYLSVLRARRLAPIDVFAQSTRPTEATSETKSPFRFLRYIIRPSDYPAEGLTGDEPFVRTSESSTECAEAELMLYIGEILFATATSKPEEGLGWTKQSVEISQRGSKDVAYSATEKQKCKDCLQAGVSNWNLMAKKLADQSTASTTGSTVSGWKSWFGAGGTDQVSSKERWLEEAKTAQAMHEKIIRDGIDEQMASRTASSIFFG